MADDPRRHGLLDVAPVAWAALLAARPDLDGVPHLAGWAEAGWPVILRRRNAGEPAGALPAGLPLPPADGKRRIGLLLPPDGARPRPAVTLPEARAAAPASWQPAIDALLALGAAHGLVPRVFGALLWQHLTGLTYLTASSDLDLLWPTAGPVDRSLLGGLAAIASAAPMRLDGEVILPDGAGVAWREWHGAEPGTTVLAKGMERLELRRVTVERDGRTTCVGGEA